MVQRQMAWYLQLDIPQATGIAMAGATTLVTDATRRTFNRASITAPVDTARLRAGHTMRVGTKGLKIRGEVISTVKYSMDVHNGTGPHIIRARRGKALAFKMGGRTVIVKSVRHPGTRAQPWLASALEHELQYRDGWRVSTARTRMIAALTWDVDDE